MAVRPAGEKYFSEQTSSVFVFNTSSDTALSSKMLPVIFCAEDTHTVIIKRSNASEEAHHGVECKPHAWSATLLNQAVRKWTKSCCDEVFTTMAPSITVPSFFCV